VARYSKPSITLTDFIRQSAWGRALRSADLDAVIGSAYEGRFQPGESIVRCGDFAASWVGLIDGLVVQQVVGRDGKLAALTSAFSGVWFGEGTLMREGRWQYDAVARRETRAAFIPRDTFMALLGSDLSFSGFIAHLLNDRLSHYMGLLANERLTGAEVRLARVLASLFDPHLYPARPALLRISQGEVALLAGMSRQRANAALKLLEAAGLVALERGGLRVLDLGGLGSYGGALRA